MCLVPSSTARHASSASSLPGSACDARCNHHAPSANGLGCDLHQAQAALTAFLVRQGVPRDVALTFDDELDVSELRHLRDVEAEDLEELGLDQSLAASLMA